ncbi:MAG TPA: hypothetical protein VGD40_11920 [Chryseosolibacter sp.]
MDQNSYQTLGYIVGLVLRFVMMGALIVALVAYFKKRFQIVRVIKNIFTWIFLAWGGICLVIFAGNLMFGNIFYEFLVVCIICLGVGFLLRKLRLPQQ